MTIKIDLPNEDEMYAIIKEYIDDYRTEIPIEWDNGDVREAASTLAGVTKIEAENVIAALIANKCIRKSDMDEIRFAKDRLFSDISGLEKIDVDAGVNDVGGLEGLRKWLDEKKELLKPEKRDELRSKACSLRGHSAGGCSGLWQIFVSKIHFCQLETTALPSGFCDGSRQLCRSIRAAAQGCADHGGERIAMYPMDR